MAEAHETRLIMTEAQAREVTLMVTLVKLLVVAAFVLGGWQTYVTLTLNQQTKDIAEAKAAITSAAIETTLFRSQDYRPWREDVTKIMARQTTLIEGQQQQLNALVHR